MTITVKMGASLRKKVPGLVKGEKTIEMPPGSKVTDLLDALNLTLDDVRVLMHKGRPVFENFELTDGDRLAMFPPELAFNMYVAINFKNHLREV